ncbi:MAG: diguanylate phosphodiesterase, partial [Oscillospiraceae bacterium]
MAENQDNPTTVDGVRAVEMRYRAIFSTDTKEPAFYQSSIRLNSPNMGVLLPERFMPVLESDDRCVSVFKLALLQTIKAADKFVGRELDFDWISVFMPLRLLRRKDCANILKEFTEMLGAYPNRI